LDECPNVGTLGRRKKIKKRGGSMEWKTKIKKKKKKTEVTRVKDAETINANRGGNKKKKLPG